MNKENFKRYLISSGITFLTGFCLTLSVNWDSITLESFQNGAIIGVIFTAARAGFKAVIELLITTFKK